MTTSMASAASSVRIARLMGHHSRIENRMRWSFQRDALALTPPALRESHQGRLTRDREAVCRSSVDVVAVGQRPHPWLAAGRREGGEIEAAGRREGGEEDAANDLAVGQHVVIVRAPRTACGRAEDQRVAHLAVKFASRAPASCYFAPKNCLPMPDRAGAAGVRAAPRGALRRSRFGLPASGLPPRRAVEYGSACWPEFGGSASPTAKRGNILYQNDREQPVSTFPENALIIVQAYCFEAEGGARLGDGPCPDRRRRSPGGAPCSSSWPDRSPAWAGCARASPPRPSRRFRWAIALFNWSSTPRCTAGSRRGRAAASRC